MEIDDCGGCVELGDVIICSRPDSIVWQVLDHKVEKSAQYKSKKVGALSFGTLYPSAISELNQTILSVAKMHLILLNIEKNRVLSYV